MTINVINETFHMCFSKFLNTYKTKEGLGSPTQSCCITLMLTTLCETNLPIMWPDPNTLMSRAWINDIITVYPLCSVRVIQGLFKFTKTCLVLLVL